MKIDLKHVEFKNEAMVQDGVQVCNMIPYEKKEEFAIQLVNMTLGTDDKLGVCYTMSIYGLVENYLFAKYYTDIDVSEVSDPDDFRTLYDYMQMHGLTLDGGNIYAFVCDDIDIVHKIESMYRASIEKLYEKGNSLEAIVKSLIGTDIDTNKEETRNLIEKLIDMQGALMEKEEHDGLAKFGKKPSSMKTGGRVLNFAQKK